MAKPLQGGRAGGETRAQVLPRGRGACGRSPREPTKLVFRPRLGSEEGDPRFLLEHAPSAHGDAQLGRRGEKAFLLAPIG